MISRKFQVFVKPVGARCNLSCTYCYYLDKISVSHGTGMGRMPDDLLEHYLIRHIEATTSETVFFSWHGGEPTLAGLDFYRKAVEIQKRHLPPGKKVLNGIQTNGTTLIEEWCRFLAEEKFLVGISMDGPPEMHNLHRKSGDGSPAFEKTLRGYRLLQRFNIPTEILCVVHVVNVSKPVELYAYFKSLSAKYLTFLPLVDRIPGAKGVATADSVPSESWGAFLIAIFDEWLAHDIGKIQIQMVEEALKVAFDLEHTLCIFKKNCGGVPVVEQNGDFYSCDHFVSSEYRLGNIVEHSLSWLLDHPVQQAFGLAKSQTLPAYCRKCTVLNMCHGECPKNRFISTPDGDPELNYLCSGYKVFFEHLQPFIAALRASAKGNA